MPERSRYIHNIPAARALRRPQTPTEESLWSALRDRRLRGLKFRRQHAVGRFVLDFYCHELRLAIEVDGSVHDAVDRRAADAERQTELEYLGIRFVRIRADAVERDLPAVLSQIEREIARLPSPATKGSRERGRG